MGDVRKKYRVCSTDFERENFFMAFNAGKKSYTVVSKGTIGLGNFFFTPTKSHIPGLKGQMIGLLEPKGLY